MAYPAARLIIMFYPLSRRSLISTPGLRVIIAHPRDETLATRAAAKKHYKRSGEQGGLVAKG